MKTRSTAFPKNFVWGAATSALQIEGAPTADGASPSIWDASVLRPGQVERDESPERACDHYHRFAEDIKILRDLGLRHYRFSINWNRIMPDGGSTVNPRGLDFYKRLCDALHAAGITPWATLYHWELPAALERAGGWPARATVDAFARYADAAVAGLRGHVSRWMTINELHTFIQCGYRLGNHAPFRTEPDAVVWQAHHHVLLAHGHGVRAVREHGGRRATVGFVHNPEVPVPLDESPEHIDAARARYAEVTAPYFGPLYRAEYPASWLRTVGRDRPRVARGDLALIASPTDFLGLNQYAGTPVRAPQRGTGVSPVGLRRGTGVPPVSSRSPRAAYEILPHAPDYPRGGFPWLPLTPDVLYWALRLTHELVPKTGPIYITENGLHTPDEPDPARGGEVLDLARVLWLQSLLPGLRRAAAEGYPAAGYFHWSFLDNFEWGHGYAKRLGLVHVNYATQKRTPKLSASVFARIARNNFSHSP